MPLSIPGSGRRANLTTFKVWVKQLHFDDLVLCLVLYSKKK
jgi:hypothetical protein